MAQQMVLFGGTFDPVHHGHLIVARAIAEKCGFHRITLLPAATPPHKSPAMASPAERLAMLQLAIEGQELFDICDIELNRQGPSYTVDTLLELRRLHGQEVSLHMIVGMDMVEELYRWRRANEVVELTKLVIAARNPWQHRWNQIIQVLEEKFGRNKAEEISQGIVETPVIDISSTSIRNRIANGLSCDYLIPFKVESYIRKNKLYSQKS
jgi:nicotinate-nucleotide adenylyltransferase